MLLINCPFCGLREQTEFGYHGEAHIARPSNPDSVGDAEWGDYLFFRANPKGIHRERWSHDFGCRRWFNMARDTVSGEIVGVYLHGESPPTMAGDASTEISARQKSGGDSAASDSESSPQKSGDAEESAASEMSDDDIRNLLGAIGKECFVRFFALFEKVADGELPNKSAVEILGRETDYAENSRNVRVANAKKIIAAKKSERALEMIAESPQIPGEMRARAREITAELESRK